MSTQTQKKCPKLSTQRTHSSVERWATGISETTSAKEDTRGTQESGSSLFQISAALKHTAGAMWNPHQASETQVGWEAALPVAQSHIWAREESWGQQQRRDG